MSATKNSSIGKDDWDHLECVQGRMSFARRDDNENAPPRAEPMSNFNVSMVDYDVTIRNARPLVNRLSLETEGLVLANSKVSCAAERDPEIMREQYLNEMTPFIKEYFNASWVVPVVYGGVILRRVSDTHLDVTRKNYRVTNQGAGYVHADYSPVAGPMIAARDNQQQGNEIKPYSRLIIAQTWRALSPAPQDTPLAFCDGSSVLDTDLLDAHYNRAGDRGPNVWLLHHNPAQRWYYFPHMTPDEVVLFKGYDSEAHYKVWVPHCAFDDRRTYPNAKPRESVEARFYVYYD